MQYKIRVWGKYACFTAPECKVERFSHPIMTPTAAKGVLQCILSHPELIWTVNEIALLNPIKYTTLTLKEKQNFQNNQPTLRGNQILYDVGYHITANMSIKQEYDEKQLLPKYASMFERRINKGQCFSFPYLGLKEFVGYFDWPRPEDTVQPINMEVGKMLLDWKTDNDEQCKLPVFFRANIINGVMAIPNEGERK